MIAQSTSISHRHICFYCMLKTLPYQLIDIQIILVGCFENHGHNRWSALIFREINFLSFCIPWERTFLIKFFVSHLLLIYSQERLRGGQAHLVQLNAGDVLGPSGHPELILWGPRRRLGSILCKSHTSTKHLTYLSRFYLPTRSDKASSLPTSSATSSFLSLRRPAARSFLL